mgnify:CR=1 FL=1
MSKSDVSCEKESSFLPITFTMMSNRLYQKLSSHKTEEKFKIPPPVLKIVNTKTLWTNHVKICKTMNRDEKTLMAYLKIKIGVDVSIGMQGMLFNSIIKDKSTVTNAAFNSHIRSFVKNYIRCPFPMCRSFQTEMKGNITAKSVTILCHKCKSEKNVEGITQGYRGVQRGERRKNRAK